MSTGDLIQAEDELLEALWTLREDREMTLSALAGLTGRGDIGREVEGLVVGGWVVQEGDIIKYTGPGEERAAGIIRRHRLAERLIHEVMEIDVEATEAEACSFEHTLGSQVTDSICTLLGHPPTCPHGKPIPRGACCSRLTLDLVPLIARLSDLAPGEDAVVSFITPRFSSRYQQLSSLGLIPGSPIKLLQNSPAHVVRVGETEMALDGEIAREIFVKRMNPLEPSEEAARGGWRNMFRRRWRDSNRN